jgi:integrase
MMSSGTTYDARVYRTEVYKGSEVTTYKVRWKVGGRLWKEGFRTAAQADSFRSALLTAARRGEAFSLTTGRPTAWEREKAATSWYEFACAYVDMKWKQASAKYRKDIARALTAATPAMLAEARARPDDASIRRMYYAGLRPEEAIDLSRDNMILPPPGRTGDEDWGELHIRGATPDAGSEWTDDGSPRERRQLKHRAEGDSRMVPTHPELTRLLREHLDKFGTPPLTVSSAVSGGGELPTITGAPGSKRARQF